MDLIKAESEERVISILDNAGVWQSNTNWIFFGNNENNFSIIGNQASYPESAIAEKIVNSVDAVLMRECLRRKINPESSAAPQNITEAVEQFFKIGQGSLSNIGAGLRTELAKNILFVATGRKESPCYAIIDAGEGQTPKNMPGTLLSLSKSNKLRIPFVQGKFNMGGTGVLRFCGNNNLQLIVSRKDPQIAVNQVDETKDYWGFTVVRRENPKQGMKSSTYTYLVIDGKVPMFKADSLPILPGEYPVAYYNKMQWGTYIKLFDYQISGSLRSIISFDLYDRLCLLLPKVALPVRFYERRDGYRGHSMESTMAGLSVRLDEDRNYNLENNFPSSSVLNVGGEQMSCQIFAFKQGQSEKYRKDEGLIFTVNGQTHGSISKSFFERKSVNLSYLSDSILVSVDCSLLSSRAIEDLFMNSRDRLSNHELRYEIEKRFEELLSKHPGLKALSERRRREEMENKIEDSKPLKEVLENIIRKSPSLASLFIPGFKIKNPFNLRNVGQQELYVGKEFPTFFKLKLDGIKHCPVNKSCRIQYETDAANDYFDRDKCRGKFELFLGTERVSQQISLWNGIGTLAIKLPENITIGALLDYKSIVNDPTQYSPFQDAFKVQVTEEVKEQSTGSGEPKNPRSTKDGSDRQTESALSLPRVLEIHENDWGNHGFGEQSALDVKYAGEQGYDFYVNMDNRFLLSEIRQKTELDAKLLQERFKYSLVLIGLALIKDNKNNENSSDGSFYKQISDITKTLSPIILPMISFLGDLKLDE